MAKSSTLKQGSLLQAERSVQIETVKVASDIVTNYIRRWAQIETQRLINSHKIPILTIKNGLQVGKYRVRQHNNAWNLTNPHGERIALFSSKKSAVLYSILTQTQRYKSADEILLKDEQVSKLESNFRHYEHSLRKAAKKQDYIAVDIVASRYYDTKIQLEYARNDLEKTLRMNKYLKVWELDKPL